MSETRVSDDEDYIIKLEAELARLREENERLKVELVQIEGAIPETFYAGVETFHRIENLGRIWQNAVKSNAILEAEVERLKLSMLAHFNEEHLAGDGPEIYKWQRKLAEAQQQTQDMILERDQLLDVQKGLEAEVERLRAALMKTTAFVEIRYHDVEQLALMLERAEAEVERLRAALGEAAMSMETMANAAGSRDGLLLEMSQVRGYARSRAAVARAALRGDHCGGEPAVVRGVEKAVANLPNVTAVVQAEREK